MRSGSPLSGDSDRTNGGPRRFATPVLAIALALAGCSDDGDVGSPTTSTSASTSTSAPAGCSAASLDDEPVPQPELPAPVARMRDEIVAAAAGCDVARLGELAEAGDSQFTYSFGDDDGAAAFWRSQEERGDETLRRLVLLLDTRFATVEADPAQIVWPAAFGYETWDEVPEPDRDALRAVYSEEELASFEAFGSYVGARIGITVDGDWLFFVAGD